MGKSFLISIFLIGFGIWQVRDRNRPIKYFGGFILWPKTRVFIGIGSSLIGLFIVISILSSV